MYNNLSEFEKLKKISSSFDISSSDVELTFTKTRVVHFIEIVPLPSNRKVTSLELYH